VAAAVGKLAAFIRRNKSRLSATRHDDPAVERGLRCARGGVAKRAELGEDLCVMSERRSLALTRYVQRIGYMSPTCTRADGERFTEKSATMGLAVG